MRSLQVLTPHKKCIYNCPFCISKSHNHDNLFVNNYDNNNFLWKRNLEQVIQENEDLKFVVITGTNEPMQSVECVKDIINVIRSTNSNIQIEIQTRYYHQNDIYNMVDVVAYSISNVNLLNKIKPMGNIQRYVLILTDSYNGYNLNDIINKIPNSISQVTFKCLHDSNGVNEELDSYIYNHKINKQSLEKLRKDIISYQGDLSILLDEFSMNCEGRYKIFREDGNLYNNWNEVGDDSAKGKEYIWRRNNI